jgi:hypothetical protein
MSAWLGRKLAGRIIGRSGGATAFAEIKHPTHQLYHGPLVLASRPSLVSGKRSMGTKMSELAAKVVRLPDQRTIQWRKEQAPRGIQLVC